MYLSFVTFYWICYWKILKFFDFEAIKWPTFHLLWAESYESTQIKLFSRLFVTFWIRILIMDHSGLFGIGPRPWTNASELCYHSSWPWVICKQKSMLCSSWKCTWSRIAKCFNWVVELDFLKIEFTIHIHQKSASNLSLLVQTWPQKFHIMYLQQEISYYVGIYSTGLHWLLFITTIV